MILKALKLPDGSKIGVPLYSCTVVFDAIIKAGYEPYFIDITFDNYTMDTVDLAEKINDLSAIIVIHTFGRPAEMDTIRRIAGEVPVIEDCAHSLLSRYKDRQTGTLGFASIFSFKKYLSMSGGGMIILNDDKFAQRFRREIGLLDLFTVIDEIGDAFVTYGDSILYRRPWFGLFAYKMGSYLRSILDNDGGIDDFLTKKIRKTHFNLLSKKLNGFEKKVELQRQNSFFLIEELAKTSLVLPHEERNTHCNYYLFPIRFNNRKERDKAHEYLSSMGIDTAKLYGETPMKARRFYGYEGDCPNSEIVADTVLIIPNYYTLSKKDLLKVTSSIKKLGGLL